MSPYVQLVGYLAPRFSIQKWKELKFRCKTTFEKPRAFKTKSQIFKCSTLSSGATVSRPQKASNPKCPQLHYIHGHLLLAWEWMMSLFENLSPVTGFGTVRKKTLTEKEFQTLTWKTFESPFLTKCITFSSKWYFPGRTLAFHSFLISVRKPQSPNSSSTRTSIAFQVKIW